MRQIIKGALEQGAAQYFPGNNTPVTTPKDSDTHTMATFYANPDDSNEPWIEKAAMEGLSFRIWHVMFFCFAGCMSLVILICCCVKIRVPRTKQEIEADYRRKKLAGKFKQRLMLIQNQEMDEIDLKRALEIIQEDYNMEARTIDKDIPFYPDYNLEYDNVSNNLKAEPQQAQRMSKSPKLPTKLASGHVQ